MSETVKVTNRDLMRMEGTLTEFGSRFLPSTPADMRLARLLTWVRRYSDGLSSSRSKISLRVIEENGGTEAISKMPNLTQQAIAAKIQIAQEEFDAEEVEVELPSKLLDQNMLPKEKTGDDGWKNGTAMGVLIANLGPLYEFPKDE